MSTAEQEVESFRQFVHARAQQDAASLSLEDYVCLWRASQERDETIAAIEEGLDDLNRGRVRDSKDVLRDMRARLG